MSGFEPARRLDVFRRLESGDRVLASQLARNRQGVFFQYAAETPASGGPRRSTT